MMSQNIKFKKAYTFALGFFALVVGATSCKEKTTIGTDLVPPIDNINTFGVSDFDLSLKNGIQDTLLTNDYSYMLVALGQVNDPYFGHTRGGVFMQYTLPTFNFEFPEGTYDSVVLTIPYYVTSGKSYFYGDTTAMSALPLKLNAYHIEDDWKFDKDKLYYSFDSLKTNTTIVGTGTYMPKDFLDTVILGTGDTVPHALRMKLDNSVLTKLRNTPTENLTTSSTFVEYFKGLYIAPDANTASNWLGLFRMDGGTTAAYGNAQLNVFYTPTGDTTPRNIIFKFDPAMSPFFNRIKRDYTNAPVAQDLSNSNSDKVIIQSYPGIYTDVNIALDNKIPKAVVNKASLELVVKAVGSEPFFNPPVQLLMRGLNDDGTEYTLADRLNSTGGESQYGQTFLGGTPTTKLIDGEYYVVYTLNLPREVQQKVNEGKDHVKVRIYSSTAHPAFYRMVGYGPNDNSNLKLKFDVVYSLK